MVPNHRRKEKPRAFSAYRIALRKASRDEILGGYRRHLESEDWIKDGGKWIPYPSKWLSRECWRDPTTPSQPTEQEQARDEARSLFKSLREPSNGQ